VIRRRLVVRGRVQGVFYRDSVRRLATARGIAGSATNLGDGSVEVVLEGPRDAVGDLIAYCAEGPDHAEVSGVEVEEEEPQGIEGFDTA
jgi:acylphosphatase